MTTCLDCGAASPDRLCRPCGRVAVQLLGSEQARIDLLETDPRQQTIFDALEAMT